MRGAPGAGGGRGRRVRVCVSARARVQEGSLSVCECVCVCARARVCMRVLECMFPACARAGLSTHARVLRSWIEVLWAVQGAACVRASLCSLGCAGDGGGGRLAPAPACVD